MRNRPCQHVRHYRSGKVTSVNRGLFKSRKIIRRVASKSGSYMLNVVQDNAKEIILSKIQNQNYDLYDSTLKSVVTQTLISQGVPAPLAEMAVENAVARLKSK